MTSLEILAIALLLPAAALSLRKAPYSSAALLNAFIVNVGYAVGLASGEWLRWISAIVGLVGAVEFGRGAERTKSRIPVSIPDALRKVDAATWIGLLLLASMGVDGLGMILFRKLGIWIVPEMTIGILILVGLVGLFGKENEG